MVDDISQFKFPILTPYPGQVELMQQLYQNLQHPSSKLCMVESPTGTGKTLSTLCSILAYLDSYYGLGNEKENKISEINEEEDFVKWLKTQESYHSQHKKAKIAIENSQIHQKARKRILLGKNGIEPEEIGEDERCRIQKIFICSRTHSQLSQILKEFNRTDFKRNYSISVCGSRSQFCINSDLKNCKSDLELSERCKEAVKFSRCGHFNQENIEKSKFEILNSLDDIEDLMKSEKNAKFSPCPFYSLNRAAEESDVVLMTYSHLFMNLVNFEQGIVIIDESHNIEDALAGLFSNSLNRAYLQEIISSLDSYWKKFGNKMKESSILILKKFKILSFKVLALLNSYKSKNSTILQAAEFASSIDFDLKTALDIVCEAVDSKLLQKLHSFGDFTNKNIFQIQTFFSNLLNYHSLGVLAISESSLSFHLLDFKELLHKIVSKSKLTILMAGTLTPFDATLSCLKSDFNSTLLSYGHVIDKKRAFISALSSFVITEKTKSHHLVLK
ncbi:MAG: DEAD H (Asp-Glu-Ala-Asp His) box helicase 11 [Paramarteilia canceri]